MYAPIQRYLDTVHESLLDVRGGTPLKTNSVLAAQDPNLCGLAMTTSDGFTYTSGDAEVPFAMQSISISNGPVHSGMQTKIRAGRSSAKYLR